jgi:hypothetical protein
MNRKLERIIIASLVSIAILVQPGITANAAQAALASSPFAPVQGLDYEERDKQYEALKLSPAGWQVGMVISKEPYAVVTKVDTMGANVRIWTGVIARDYNDLLVYWDEIRVESSGRVAFHATDVGETMTDYFENASQESYRTKAYLGKFPWADIPTDAEAALEGSSKVSSDGVVNVYGIVFQDQNRAQASSPGPVKKETDIPDVVPTLKRFKETAVTKLPSDAESHWAQEEILDLMKKSIIEGYEDHTIRPDRTLSKAEFITLLVKSLGIDPAKSGVSGYEDMNNHWSGPMIAAAQGSGLLEAKPVDLNFAPDMAISRMEMAELINRILLKYKVTLKAESLTFTDTGRLPEANKAALKAVVNAGIVGGYPDGSFRPEGSLTRAEAFKVISRVIHLL